jgi:solute carrier family 25 (mitochondrial iron transporter), member 28/37
MSDAVFTPMDAVKQKMQLALRPYSGFFDCIVKTYRNDGFRHGFYAGYTTTLVMNVPYSGMYFCSYEALKQLMSPNTDEETPVVHCLAGGGAGVFSAAVTNPLDVARTRLQTQGDVQKQYRGMVDVISQLWRDEGYRGLTRGISARMLFHSMAASICWVTYEWMKKFLGDDIGTEDELVNHHH